MGCSANTFRRALTCHGGPLKTLKRSLTLSTHDHERRLDGRRPLKHLTSIYSWLNNQVLLPLIESSQFTSRAFTGVLQEAGVAISMDGVGRAIDNVFIERLWRTLKYDHVYLNPAASGNACRDGTTEFLNY